uniref:CCHC-type domain-containing protein n=1 Tax=Lactuca sativa TaxID=4236 RepID=A0A9R1V1R4_LACSA|nr:hypothetical protein LSAT_V11C700363980 [Lactuca sativa]
MVEGSSVSAHVLKMKAYVKQLSRLRFLFGDELATNVILASWPKSFNQFVMNFTVNDWERRINELHKTLKNVEASIKKSGNNQVLMIREGQISKKKNGNNTGKGKGKAAKKGKGKGKGKGKPPSTNPTPKPKPAANSDCFHCNEKGHQKCKCPKYLKEPKKIKVNQVVTLGFYTNSWVFDTGSGTNICNDLQGLKNVRELRDGDSELHVSNGT